MGRRWSEAALPMNDGDASTLCMKIDASMPPELRGAASRTDDAGNTSLNHLLRLLEAEYGRLLARLTSSLRSSDAATDALHDAYLKLGSGAAVGEIRQPLSYLYRMAINLAKNRRRRETRFAPVDISDFDTLPDDAPNPEYVVGAQQEMARALSALSALPTRQREIFLARWRDDKTQAQIAEEFRLHKRTVQKELTRAERHLRAVLGREKPRK